MYSYIAITWAEYGAPAEEVARLQHGLRSLQDSQIVMSAPGILIVQKPGLSSACSACVLPDMEGAVLGTLFRWPDSDSPLQRQLAIDAADARRIVMTRGRHLVARYWGRYVAFVRNHLTGCYVVIRDPSGALPCFQTTHRGVQIWFSRFEDLSSLGLPAAPINWSYVEQRVVSPSLRSHATGLVGVYEVPAGESWEFRDGHVQRRVMWDPAAISAVDVLEEPGVAAEYLRSVMRTCVDAWACAYGGILHLLSGGLDSSIVAVILGRSSARTPVTCVNNFTTEAEGDERFYARLVANKAGFELIERHLRPEAVNLRSILKIAASPNPGQYRNAIEHADYEVAQAHLQGAGAIFTGEGSDGTFYRCEGSYSVADYVRRHGFTSELPAIALNAARLEGASLLATLWHALCDRKRRSQKKWLTENLQQQSLVSKQAFAAQVAEHEAHFAMSDRKDLLVGKWWQIFNTGTAPAFYHQFDNPLALERVRPLLSQPIVELCLRIPSYVLVDNGWDRAMARRAFANDLPAAVVSRRGRGGIEKHAHTIFRSNIQFLRAFMLDGELARRGYLDRERLERCLSEKRSLPGYEFLDIQHHLSVEAWIRRQIDRSAGIAA